MLTLVMLIRLIKVKSKGKYAIWTLILPLIFSALITMGITSAFHVEKDTPKEMLSLPFQQTARYVRDYGDEGTEEEKAAIGQVLDYDKIAKGYMELTSDPVKTTYHAKEWQVMRLGHSSSISCFSICLER